MIDEEITGKLKELGIHSEEVVEIREEEKLVNAARKCARTIKKRIWFQFDVFMARGRPGLEVEGEPLPEKKKKKKKRRKKKSAKNETETDESKIETKEQENLIPTFEPVAFLNEERSI